MYLTRMFVNSRLRSAVKLLGSPQCMHAAVMNTFGPGALDTEAPGRVLWRLDTIGDRQALYIASPVEPDMRSLVEQAGWINGESSTTRPYAPLLDSISDGQLLRFRLTANPTHSVRKPGWEDTKPCGHTTVKQQEDWLLQRCTGWGFTIPDGTTETDQLSITDRRTLRFRRGSKHVTLAQATYEGLLTVTNPTALRSTLTAGVGRGKAYGCGLLTISPK